MTDIEIANSAKLLKITQIAAKLGIEEEQLETYGNYKAKLNISSRESRGKLILVTAINPTPYGEGKTTMSIGLADGMAKLGKNVCLALREPSLGPVFGIKGGATGGGHAQIAPMEDINLHFTGDMHAITSANNLLSAMLDNHLQMGNELGIDVRRITWKRCVDLNDRALRNIMVGMGGVNDGVPREDGFTITAASEIMAILCLANSLDDLKRRLGNIIVGYNFARKPVFARDLRAENAMTILLKDAIKPNLVQTLEGTPAIVHGGPFANIAHGCNSLIATVTALGLADYVVTEAGFGADLGAEKFLDIKCRVGGLTPSVVVLVATVRALKFNGGLTKDSTDPENIAYLERGVCNLTKHIENLTNVYNMQVVVAINKFITDTDEEVAYLDSTCRKLSAKVVLSRAWEFGGEGSIDLAREVIDMADHSSNELTFAYDTASTISEKIERICKRIYGAGEVVFADTAARAIRNIENIGFDKLPICIAKTQYSFSDNPKLLGRPQDFTFTISDVVIRGGAEFIVAIAGKMMLMPGLPKVPVACGMEIDSDAKINGLF